MRIWHISTDSESGSWWIFKFFNKKEIDAKRLTLKTNLNLKKSFHPKFFANVRRYVVLTRYIKHFLLICLRYQQTYTVLSLFTLRSSLTFINLIYKSSELINYAIYSTGFLMIFFICIYKLFNKKARLLQISIADIVIFLSFHQCNFPIFFVSYSI